MPATVLALVPHPDDAEFYAGGLLAKLASEGARVYIVVATDGRRGSFEADSDTLIAARAEEMRRAAAALGAEPPILLGYPDMESWTRCLRASCARSLSGPSGELRPDVVVAEDPYAPFEPHPDHRAVAWAATEAINYLAPAAGSSRAPGGRTGAASRRREVLLCQRPDPGEQVHRHKRVALPRKVAALAEHREPGGVPGGRA